jgi:hypothetical protein
MLVHVFSFYEPLVVIFVQYFKLILFKSTGKLQIYTKCGLINLNKSDYMGDLGTDERIT